MSLSDEMRTFLAANPGATSGELFEACESAVNSTSVAAILKGWIDNGAATRIGNPGAYCYTLNPDHVPARASPGTRAAPPPKPAGRAKAAKKTAPAAKRPKTAKASKPARKPHTTTLHRALVPVQQDDNFEPFLRPDGSVMLRDRAGGTEIDIPAAALRGILSLVAMVRPA